MCQPELFLLELKLLVAQLVLLKFHALAFCRMTAVPDNLFNSGLACLHLDVRGAGQLCQLQLALRGLELHRGDVLLGFQCRCIEHVLQFTPDLRQFQGLLLGHLLKAVAVNDAEQFRALCVGQDKAFMCQPELFLLELKLLVAQLVLLKFHALALGNVAMAPNNIFTAQLLYQVSRFFNSKA